ncbi:MAG TPA: ABATE domain-containing protein [Dehalococcoidia bacterium]
MDGAQANGFDFGAGALCLDFVNTVDWRHDAARRRDGLGSYGALVEWGRQAGLLPDGLVRSLRRRAAEEEQAAAAALGEAVALRDAVYRIFAAVIRGGEPAAADLARLNRALDRGLRHLRVVPAAGGFAWRWEQPEGDLLPMLWPVARSAADLLVSGDLDRVRECDGDPCGWLFLDRSRNRSRRWCDMSGCGNRAKARRHYQRRRGRAEAGA